MSEIPPYQTIDLSLSSDHAVTIQPIKGFTVTFPDSKLDCEIFTIEDATPDKLVELKAKSKWPDQIFYRPCWIHYQQFIKNEGIANRKYWSPR